MSEMTLFQSGNTLPAHLRRGTLSATTKALMGGGTSKRISIEGNVFRMLVGGKEVAVNEDRGMNVIILRAAESNARTYYGGKTYEKGTKARPICWSDDNIKPHENVKALQHKSCAGCPQDVKGSGQNGSKACRYSRRVALLLASDIGGDIFAMNVNASSLFGQGEGRKMGLQQYARLLGGHGIEVNAVVTEMRFDTTAGANMKLTFSAVRPLEEDEWALVQSRVDEQAAMDAITQTVADIDGVEEEVAEAPAPEPVFVEPPKSTKPKAAAAPAAPAGGFKVTKAAAPAVEEVEEPVVRETKSPAPLSAKAVLADWGDDADD